MKKTNTLLLLFIFTISIFTSSCYRDGLIGIRGVGPMVTQDVYMPEFTGVDLQISCSVVLSYGVEQEVSIEGQQNIIDNLKYRVSGDKWQIEFDRNVRDYDGLTIYITLPYIDELEINGSGSISSNSEFNSNSVDLNISGSGSISLDIVSNYLYTNISGSGNIDLFGSSNQSEFNISGSGKLNAFNYVTKECDVNISGSGNTNVFVTDKLEANISGSGNIYYIGYPAINTHVSGSGNIHSLN